LSESEFYGILGHAGKEWAREHRRRNEAVFATCEAVVFDCSHALHGKATNLSLKHLLVSPLFGRCLDHFQASVLLLEYGMIPAAKVVLRALCEAMFACCAVSRNESAARAYMDDDLRQRRKLVNKALDSTGRELAIIRDSATPEAMAQLRNQIQESGAKEVKTEEFAKLAGLHDWYLVIYLMLSRAVHSQVRDFDKNFVRRADGSIECCTLGPSDGETGRLLAIGALGMVNARGALDEVYGQDPDPFFDKYEPFFRKITEDWTRNHPGYDEWGTG
jgi:hypothetical protein